MGAIFHGKPLECFLLGAQTIQNSVNLIPSYTESIIVQYTVPVGNSFSITGGSASGMVDTEFRLYVDNILKEVKRIAWTERNILFNVSENILSGKIIKITAYHENPISQNYDASIFGILL